MMTAGHTAKDDAQTEKHEANRGIARFQIVFRRDGRYAWQLINHMQHVRRGRW